MQKPHDITGVGVWGMGPGTIHKITRFKNIQTSGSWCLEFLFIQKEDTERAANFTKTKTTTFPECWFGCLHTAKLIIQKSAPRLARWRELKSSYYGNGLTSPQSSYLAQQDQNTQYEPSNPHRMASGFLPLLADPSIVCYQAFPTHLWIPSPPLLLQAHRNPPHETGRVYYFTNATLFRESILGKHIDPLAIMLDSSISSTIH